VLGARRPGPIAATGAGEVQQADIRRHDTYLSEIIESVILFF
jgi:hypothetical protein